MKRFLVLLLALALCATMLGCAVAEEKKLVIGEVFWGLHDSYQHAHQVQTQKYCDELGIEFIAIDGLMSAETQAAGMEDLIAKKVDGIICQAYDQASMELSIEMAQEAGIPVVSFVNVASGDILYPSVEISEEEGAIQMGRLVGEHFKEKWPDTQVKLVTISDPSVEWAHNQRTLAFVKGLEEACPDLEYVFNGGKSEREIAYSMTEDVLQKDPDCNVFFGYDAENGLGCIAALEASGRGEAEDNDVKTEFVASVDGSTDEILKVMDPSSSYVATLALRPSVTASACVDMMLKVINGEIDMHDNTQNVKIPSYVINCWDMSIDDTEAFLKDEWEMDLDIRAELGL